MIAINLLPGAKKKGAKRAAFKLPDVKSLAAVGKDPWLLACVTAYAALAVTMFLFWVPRNNNVKELKADSVRLHGEQRQLLQVILQKEEAEARDSLLRAKIEQIRSIDRERYTWPHILDAVAKAMTPFTWLDELTARPQEGEEAVTFQVTGKSADIQAITRFARNLDDSPFLEGATIVSTGEVTEAGRILTSFAMTARYTRPDTSLLTMQPLAATLVRGYRSGIARPRQR